MTDTRHQVLDTARRLFGERGYAAVTIREIAAEVGVSPAMVMKVGGSKEQLHLEAMPLEPAPLPQDVPIDGMGELLASRMLSRRDEGSAEPWLRAIYLIVDAPDPESVRRDFRERLLGRFVLEGGSAQAREANRRHCDQLACLMVGLAAGTRTLHLLEDTDRAALVREYGSLIQQVLDRIVATLQDGTEPSR